MSWVTSAKCFNGLICLGDIQATISIPPTNQKLYVNCVKKVHHVCDNLVVGFAGDIKTALLMIEELKTQLDGIIGKDKYFYLDGQSESMIQYLKDLYVEISGEETPYVELLFCWYSQDGDENEWTMYNWKFKSPKFSPNSNGILQAPVQVGSGTRHKNFQSCLQFLTGESKNRTSKFENIFEDDPEMIFLTTTKYKNFLVNQVKKEDFPGVSKSFHSFEAIVNYDKLYSEEDFKTAGKIFKSLDLELVPIDVNGDSIFGYKLNNDSLSQAKEKNPEEFENAINTLLNISSHINEEAIFEPPKFKETFYQSHDEEIKDICSTWEEFEKLFMNEFNIEFKSSGTTATA